MLNERLNWRYATKKMDPARVVPEDKIARILEAVQLAPTSSGLQPFEVIVVTNLKVREKIRAVAWNQLQVTDGSHLLVFAAWNNYTEERIGAVEKLMADHRGGPTAGLSNYYDQLRAGYLPRPASVNFEHAARQAYIAFGLAMTAAAFEEVDATPMEGFDPEAVDEILGLRDRGLRSVTLLPLGYRAAEGDWLVDRPKVRKPLEELVRKVA